jgi:hypothetical protein
MSSYRIAASLGKLFNQVNEIAPKRSKKSDGWIGDAAHFKKGSASDHNPWMKDGPIGVVTAIDITHDPKNGCDASKIVKDLVSSRDYRIKYIIHNSQMWRSYAKGSVPAWSASKYSGENSHKQHVHVSVNSEKKLYDDSSSWALSELSSNSLVLARSGVRVLSGVPGRSFTAMAGMPLCWGKKVTAAFKARVVEISQALAVDPNDLMAVMAFESGRSFSPLKKSPVSSATGLIQFIEPTARALGTTTAKLAAMSDVQQLDYVYAYLKPYAGRIGDIYDLYMAVLWPKAVGQPKSYVLFAAPSKQYTANRGLDANSDEVVTKAEAADKVVRIQIEGMQEMWLG